MMSIMIGFAEWTCRLQDCFAVGEMDYLHSCADNEIVESE